ncbi:MAG: ATP-binding protein [Sulfuricellaceae bacterium]|nr:ATP-binding protein [Sulfuricellaceae bacterium]
MSGIYVTALYVMSGVCAFAALHHGLAVLRRRVNRIHLLFALLALAIMGLVLARAGAYQAQTAEALVAMRKWEVAAVCVFFSLFPWFIAEYTGIRPRKLLLGLTAFFVLMFALNLIQPYGLQFTGLPQLTYLELPWGERVVDLRVLHPPLLHTIGWGGILVALVFSLYACIAQYRQGQQQKASALAWALGLFFVAVMFNLVINRLNIEFIHTSDFGFIVLLVLMDLEMMLESRDQNRHMRAVLDHLSAAICLKDSKGRYQLVNHTFETFFHTREADIVGKNVFDPFPRQQDELIRAQERQVLNTRQNVESEEVLECDGQPRIFQSIKFPLLRPDGCVYAVGGVYVDITESRKQDETLDKFRRQLWHADRVASTGAITASLAHELCQPLSAILNNAQAGLRFMAQDKVDLDEIREIFQDIVRDDKRAATVINGLRAMLQQEIPYADLDLAQCVNEVIKLLHSEIIRHGVEVECMLDASLTVRANKTQIQQVVLNLMINALEAMAEQPAGERKLRVRVTRADGKGRISISDSGIGIPEDMLDRVFDGFYTTKSQGLGVGLEVCRSIVESHCGVIWAEANPDRGVTFHFALPFAQEASATEGATGV